MVRQDEKAKGMQFKFHLIFIFRFYIFKKKIIEQFIQM